jgi:hypothetical protein
LDRNRKIAAPLLNKQNKRPKSTNIDNTSCFSKRMSAIVTSSELLKELEIREEHLKGALLMAKMELDAFDELSVDKRTKAMISIKHKVAECEIGCSAYGVDAFSMTNSEHSNRIRKSHQQFKRDLSNLRTDLAWKQELILKSTLGVAENETKQPTNLMEYGLDLSKDSSNSLKRSLAHVNETRQTARLVNDDLVLQTETLEIVMDQALDMEESVRRSKRSLAVSKNMCSDSQTYKIGDNPTAHANTIKKIH